MTQWPFVAASDRLTETLRIAQRLGFFGRGPIEAAIAHAGQFVEAIGRAGEIGDGDRLIDLGAGGGLPGLVLAETFPRLDVVLLDRRQKRADFLARAVRRLGLDRTEVWCRDADDVVSAIATGEEPFTVVTARGFGPPEYTLRTAVGCLGRSGVVVISEPPTGERWRPELLADLGLTSVRVGGVRRFVLAD